MEILSSLNDTTQSPRSDIRYEWVIWTCDGGNPCSTQDTRSQKAIDLIHQIAMERVAKNFGTTFDHYVGATFGSQGRKSGFQAGSISRMNNRPDSNIAQSL